MMTMKESAARHMAAGVEDIDELVRLVGSDIGREPSKRVLSSYRSHFRRYGSGWEKAELDARRELNCEASRRWYAKNPEKKREACRRWYSENPALKLLQQCRGSAKTRGLECSITADDIEAMLAPMVCSATGLPLSLEHDGGTSKANPWAPSIDRVDCSKGYAPDNVRVVCWAFNMMRADFPDEVVMTLAKALAARAP